MTLENERYMYFKTHYYYCTIIMIYFLCSHLITMISALDVLLKLFFFI